LLCRERQAEIALADAGIVAQAGKKLAVGRGQLGIGQKGQAGRVRVYRAGVVRNGGKRLPIAAERAPRPISSKDASAFIFITGKEIATTNKHRIPIFLTGVSKKSMKFIAFMSILSFRCFINVTQK